MSLKLSYRDRMIFYVVMVILVLVAGFFIFIKPKFEDVERAKAAFEEKKQEQEDIDTKIATLPDIIEQIKATAKEVEGKQGIFFDEMHPYQNEMYVRDALSSLNLEITEMNTEYTFAGPIDWYTYEQLHILAYDNKISTDLYNELPQEVYDVFNNVEPPVYPSSIIGVTEMSITFESDLDLRKAYDVMDRIAEDEKAIVFNTLKADENAEEGSTTRKVTATLTLYSIYPLNVEKVLEETPEVKPIETTAEPAAETTTAE